MNTLGPQPRTWKRLAPTYHTMNTNEDSGLCMGQKQKCKTHEVEDRATLNKKQCLEEETKTLSKLMADNLGSAVAAS